MKSFLPVRFFIVVVGSFIVFGSLRIISAEELLRATIDAQMQAAWQRDNITPAPPASDGEFLRRVYLDLVGVTPTYEETVTFLKDANGDKRAKLIDRLLDDPRYARHQADVWDMILFGRNPASSEVRQRPGFQRWLKKQFAENRPYDQWVQELLLAPGDTAEHGAATFYFQYRRRAEDTAEAVSQVFLGIQLQCARCHDHPFESWKQTEFYGMAAFFARLEPVNVGKFEKETRWAIGEKNVGDVLFTGPAIDQKPGQKGKPIAPRFLNGDALQEPEMPKDYKPIKFQSGKKPPTPKFSRKDKLAAWVASKDNPYFARAIANRLWAQIMGRGLIHPVDNMSASNKPSHPELLDALTATLIEHKFDIKWYFRELCNSKTYQLSSGGASVAAMPNWFERARQRPLSAEELLESWRTVTGYDAVLTASGKEPPKQRLHGLTWGYMERFFGTPTTGTGDFQGGLHEHLYLNNGELGRIITTQKGGLYDAVLNSQEDWPQRVDRLYLSILNRQPTESERARFVEYLTADEKPSDRIREAIWTLMTCSEFRFNH